MASIDPGQIRVVKNKSGGVDVTYKSSSGTKKKVSSFNNLSDPSQLQELISRYPISKEQLSFVKEIAAGDSGAANPSIHQAVKADADAFYSSSSPGAGTNNTQGVMQFNPQTGERLKEGEIVEFEGKTYKQGDVFSPRTAPVLSNTAAAKAVTSTTTNQNPQSFALSGNNLKVGSSGDDVKRLQQYLQGIGLYQGKVDGIFGPQTSQSVKQFQASKGLTADGVVGPKTASAIGAIQTGATPPVNTQASPSAQGASPTSSGTFNTGDPAQDALLKEIQEFMKKQLEQGLKINPDLNFDEKTLEKFLETAKKQVSPYFAQQIDTIKQDVLRTAPQILQEYGDTVASEEDRFKRSLDTSRENNAQSGLAFSGQRNKEEFGMEDSTNRNLASLSSAYGNKFYELGRSAEQKIGQSNMNFNLPSISSYSASLGGNGAFNQGGTTLNYKPGGYKIGSIENERESAIESRRQALINTASENIRNGRSYKDLFN